MGADQHVVAGLGAGVAERRLHVEPLELGRKPRGVAGIIGVELRGQRLDRTAGQAQRAVVA